MKRKKKRKQTWKRDRRMSRGFTYIKWEKNTCGVINSNVLTTSIICIMLCHLSRIISTVYFVLYCMFIFCELPVHILWLIFYWFYFFQWFLETFYKLRNKFFGNGQTCRKCNLPKLTQEVECLHDLIITKESVSSLKSPNKEKSRNYIF